MPSVEKQFILQAAAEENRSVGRIPKKREDVFSSRLQFGSADVKTLRLDMGRALSAVKTVKHPVPDKE